MGVFGRMMEGLAAGRAEPKTDMIDATYLKAHRRGSSLRVKKGISGAELLELRCIGRKALRLTTRSRPGCSRKLRHAACDRQIFRPRTPLASWPTWWQIGGQQRSFTLLSSAV